jgi:hypothetical protein
VSPLSRDSFPLSRRSPIDEDDDRERDIAQRPPRPSGGPFPLYGESHPRHPDPRCKECGERLGDADRAEVYINADTLRDNAGGQWVLVDDIPESEFGPYLVHADPCSRAEEGGRPKYDLA